MIEQTTEQADETQQQDLVGTSVEKEEAVSEQDTTETPEGNTSEEQETFPREYVQDLREENKRYRLRAKQADDLAARLHTQLVSQDGRLQDPTDLPFNETHLEDPEAMSAAIDDLLTRKPHLKARRVAGDVGAGTRGSASPGEVDLIGIMKGMM